MDKALVFVGIVMVVGILIGYIIWAIFMIIEINKQLHELDKQLHEVEGKLKKYDSSSSN